MKLRRIRKQRRKLKLDWIERVEELRRQGLVEKAQQQHWNQLFSEYLGEDTKLQHEEGNVRSEALLKQAAFWRVALPDSPDDYEEPSNQFWSQWPFILTRDGEDHLSRHIWQRKIEIWAIVFGISSLIQMGYAIASYHFPPR